MKRISIFLATAVSAITGRERTASRAGFPHRAVRSVANHVAKQAPELPYALEHPVNAGRELLTSRVYPRRLGAAVITATVSLVIGGLATGLAGSPAAAAASGVPGFVNGRNCSVK